MRIDINFIALLFFALSFSFPIDTQGQVIELVDSDLLKLNFLRDIELIYSSEKSHIITKDSIYKLDHGLSDSYCFKNPPSDYKCIVEYDNKSFLLNSEGKLYPENGYNFKLSQIKGRNTLKSIHRYKDKFSYIRNDSVFVYQHEDQGEQYLATAATMSGLPNRPYFVIGPFFERLIYNYETRELISTPNNFSLIQELDQHHVQLHHKNSDSLSIFNVFNQTIIHTTNRDINYSINAITYFQKGKMKLLNSGVEIPIPEFCKNGRIINNEYIIVNKCNGLKGIINIDGEEILSPEYSKIKTELPNRPIKYIYLFKRDSLHAFDVYSGEFSFLSSGFNDISAFGDYQKCLGKHQKYAIFYKNQEIIPADFRPRNKPKGRFTLQDEYWTNYFIEFSNKEYYLYDLKGKLILNSPLPVYINCRNWNLDPTNASNIDQELLSIMNPSKVWINTNDKRHRKLINSKGESLTEYHSMIRTSIREGYFIFRNFDKSMGIYKVTN